MAVLDFIHRQMDGARNEKRIEGQFRARPQINDDHLLPGILFPAQLGHRDPRHAQLAQNPLPLQVFEADIDRPQPDQQAQGAAANAGQRGSDLLDLGAEEIAQEYETTPIKERAERVQRRGTG